MKPLRLALLALAGSAALFAQYAPRLVAEIPFAFEMANEKLPSGEYEISTLGNPSHILVSCFEWRKAAFALAWRDGDGTKDGDRAELVFNKYGDRHFLARINHSDSTFTVPKSRSERMLVTSTLISAAKPERILIAARLF